MRSKLKGLLGVAVLAGALIGATNAGAVANGPTTRDCSLKGGADPDFVQIMGVSVSATGALTATGSSVSILASESSDPGDMTHHVTLTVTRSAAGMLSKTFKGAGTGRVTLAIPLTGAAGTKFTLKWKAVFDSGFHACPGAIDANSKTEVPFVVTSA